jgi:single-strand DNA-binding protein
MLIILAHAKALLIFHLSDMRKTSTTIHPAPTDDSMPMPDTKAVEGAPGAEEKIELTSQILTLNTVNLVGRVGADPEIRFFESGSAKATLSLAVRRRAKDAPPDWFNIELWGKTAEIAANYIRKGDKIGVTGYFKIEIWSDHTTGTLRSKPIVNANQLYLLGSKQDRLQAEDDTNLDTF